MVWVCVGRRSGEEDFAYVQTFNFLSEAREFIRLAKAHANPEINGIVWEALDVPTTSAADALADWESMV